MGTNTWAHLCQPCLTGQIPPIFASHQQPRLLVAAHLNCKNYLPDNEKILYCYVITLMSQIITTGILVALHCKSLSQQTVRFTCGSLFKHVLHLSQGGIIYSCRSKIHVAVGLWKLLSFYPYKSHLLLWYVGWWWCQPSENTNSDAGRQDIVGSFKGERMRSQMHALQMSFLQTVDKISISIGRGIESFGRGSE